MLDLIEGFGSIVVDSVVLCLISTSPIAECDFDAQDESERAIFLTYDGTKRFIHRSIQNEKDVTF